MVHGARLLVVEDDAATREVLALLLEGEGWAVEASESGEAALGLLARGGVMPAVVLCDVHLPGVCGEALARALRGEVGEGVVLLAMTASVRAGSGTGYDAVLGKPFVATAVEAAWRQRMEMPSGYAAGGLTRMEDVGSFPTSESEIEDAAVLEVATVKALRGKMGEARARGFYAFALADAEERVGRMGAAVAVADGAAFVREAHALKGSCGMMGARRLWRLAAVMESSGLRAGSGEALAQMDVELAEVRLMLKTFSAI